MRFTSNLICIESCFISVQLSSGLITIFGPLRERGDSLCRDLAFLQASLQPCGHLLGKG